MAIEILSFPIKKMVDLSIVFCKRLPGRVFHSSESPFSLGAQSAEVVILDHAKGAEDLLGAMAVIHATVRCGAHALLPAAGATTGGTVHRGGYFYKGTIVNSTL